MEVYKITAIEEPDFGCEGRPDGYIQKDKVWLKSASGEEITVEAADAFLIAQNLNAGDAVTLGENGRLMRYPKGQLL